jgi:PAS domain S-box-containing protein
MLALVLAAAANVAGATRFIDNALHHAWFELFQREPSGQLLLVAIEDQSLAALGVWPWSRGYHAAVVDRLVAAGARRIALDVILSAASSEAEDDRLEEALAAADGRVAIPAVVRQSGAVRAADVEWPLARFAEHAAVASITVWPDSDGRVRRLPLAVSAGGDHVAFMSAWLAGVAAPAGGAPAYSVDYAIPPNRLDRLAYVDVLAGAFDASQVAGRDILIGSTVADLGSVVAVPLWGGLTGAGVIALGYESLVQGRALTRLPGWIGLVLAAVAAVGVLPLFARLPLGRGGLILLASLAAAGLISAGLYLWGASLLSVGVVMASLVLGYAFGLVARVNAQALQIAAQARSIEERQALLRAIYESTSEGIVTIDTAGTILNANPAAVRIFGYREDELLGQNVRLLMPEPHRSAHDGYLRRYLETGEPRLIGTSREFSGVRKSGEVFPLDLSVVQAKLHDSRVFIGALRDLSQRKAAEAQLTQAQKMEAVGQLAGGIAHDFNNLLTVILGNAEIITTALPANDKLLPLAEMIRSAAERGASLTKRLLGFSRRQALRAEPLDVSELVRSLHALLQRTLGEHIDIRELTEERPWTVLADRAQLENALLNLAINARDAMPGGGHLLIETANVELDEDYVAITPEASVGPHVMIGVTDTGGGIGPAVLARVFEPFFTTKEVGKGSGLGLSMVYGFVRQSGGHIRIYSEVGHGTTVRLYLPRAAEGGPQAPAAPQESATGTETILLVEDDALVREVAARQIRGLGYEVVEAGDGAAALKLVEGGVEFDLLLTDVVMPGGMNGRELAEEVRKLRPAVKVLYTSGYPESVIVHQGTLDPGVVLLAKPYRRSELARKIRAVLDAGRR